MARSPAPTAASASRRVSSAALPAARSEARAACSIGSITSGSLVALPGCEGFMHILLPTRRAAPRAGSCSLAPWPVNSTGTGRFRRHIAPLAPVSDARRRSLGRFQGLFARPSGRRVFTFSLAVPTLIFCISTQNWRADLNAGYGCLRLDLIPEFRLPFRRFEWRPTRLGRPIAPLFTPYAGRRRYGPRRPSFANQRFAVAP